MAIIKEFDLTVHHKLSEPSADWNGLFGLPGATPVQQVVRGPLQDSVYYLCGPPAMIAPLEHGSILAGVAWFAVR